MAVPVPLARSVVPVSQIEPANWNGWLDGPGTNRSGTLRFSNANTAIAQEGYALVVVGANTLVYNPGGAGVEDTFIKVEINGATDLAGFACIKDITSTTASGSNETFILNLKPEEMITHGNADPVNLSPFVKFNFHWFSVDSAGTHITEDDDMSGGVDIYGVWMMGALRFKPAIIPSGMNATVLIEE